jgi:hypothetical protein
MPLTAKKHPREDGLDYAASALDGGDGGGRGGGIMASRMMAVAVMNEE